VFAAEEDFGISVVEAQACGTPVICYGKGGVLDSVVNGETGVYFYHQSPESIVDGIRRFESLNPPLSAGAIHAQAKRFGAERFRKQFARYLSARWREHLARIGGPSPLIEKSLAMSA
jgi:glycosyltransferase involved in cell wall biosynthesis